MYLRPLTDAELVIIWEAKKTANAALKRQREELTKQIKKMPNGAAKDHMRWRRDRLKDITGKPVIVSQDGESVKLDYERLQKLNRSLEKRHWSRTMTIKRLSEKSALVIEYSAGEIGINELPAYQLELLGALPVVDLKYGFDFLN